MSKLSGVLRLSGSGLWVFATSRFTDQASINLVGEVHHTSCHLAHSFLFGGDCNLSEVAYGRILGREVVVPVGNHPLALGGSLSGPCQHSRQRNVHNTQKGVQR